MAKKQRINAAKVLLNSSAQTTDRKNQYLHFIPVGFIGLYLLLDFIPECGALDVAGPQWLYLTIINAISTGYIFYFQKSHHYGEALSSIMRLVLSKIYLFLFALAGLSILFALNKTESMVCYANFINTLIAFFNVAILLNGRLQSLTIIAQMVSAMVLIQSLGALSAFFDSVYQSDLGTAIYNLKGTAGNKNTLATSLVVKLSFVMYCVYTFKSWTKFIHVPVLILGIITVFIINTRSAYLGLFLQLGIVLAFGVLQYIKSKQRQTILTQIGPVILSAVFAFFIAQTILQSAAALQTHSSTTESLVERIGSIASTTKSSNARRMDFWAAGVDYIKQHPLVGSGYGNCKLAMVPYENAFQIDFNYGKHLHNDFLETAMELGIIGGIAFLALFVCLLYYAIRIWRSQADEYLKYIAVFSLVALAGYFTDAAFNFPSERPIMQLLFALILAINGSAFVTHQPKQANTARSTCITLFALTSMLLLSIAFYYKYFTYRSLVTQAIISQDDFPNTGNHTAAEINPQLPDIPNLAAIANSPVAVIKAWYLSKDGKYDEALALLNKSTAINPYNMANEFVKAQLFYRTNKLDSAFYYAQKGFNTRPSNIGFYGLITDISKARNDVPTIKQSFKQCVSRRSDVPNVWNKYIEALLNLHYNQDSLLVIAQSAEKIFPEDKIIRKNRFMINAVFASNKNDIDALLANSLKIVEIDPQDYSYLENIGACYLMQRKYQQALPYLDKVIAAKAFSNGKSEYIKSLCLINMGKKEEACAYIQMAATNGFMDAAQKMATYCK